MTDEEVWRSAQQQIEMYGDDAVSYVLARALQFEQDKDTAGVQLMRRIADAIEILQQRDAQNRQPH